MLYQDDGDFEEFKAKIIKKLIIPSQTKEVLNAHNKPTTAIGG